MLGLSNATRLDWVEAYMFHQGSLVLESITLAEMVELVIKVLVNLACGTVLDEKTAKNSETTHPEDLTGSSNTRQHARTSHTP